MGSRASSSSDEILQKMLQSAFSLIVWHQPHSNARGEFSYVVDKPSGRNLRRQIESEHAEPAANCAPSISWFLILRLEQTLRTDRC